MFFLVFVDRSFALAAQCTFLVCDRLACRHNAEALSTLLFVTVACMRGPSIVDIPVCDKRIFETRRLAVTTPCSARVARQLSINHMPSEIFIGLARTLGTAHNTAGRSTPIAHITGKGVRKQPRHLDVHRINTANLTIRHH